MKSLSFKINPDHLLVSVFLCLLWVVTNSNNTSASTTTVTSSTEAKTTLLPTTLPILSRTKPPPENVNDVRVLSRNESSITLMWNKVHNISTYTLQYDNEGTLTEKNISASHPEASVTYVVSLLAPGTEYNFTLITVSGEAVTSGYNFSAVTAPENVKDVKVSTRNESSITLMWDKVPNISTYTLQYENKGSFKEENINASHPEASVTYVVSSLVAGTEYNFTLITVSGEAVTSGYYFSAATAPENVKDVKVSTWNESSITLMWNKVHNISTYTLQYDNEGTLTEKNIRASHPEASVTYVVSLLAPGTEYNFTLVTVFGEALSSGYNFSAVTAPENVKDVKVSTRNESSITLMWDKVHNISTYTLQYENKGSFKEENINASHLEASVTYVVSSLVAGTEYNFTLITVSGEAVTSGYYFSAATAPENVKDVKVSTRNESSITLMWDKVHNISTYILQYENKGSFKQENISASHLEASVTYEVSSLVAGTEYNFTLVTVFGEALSSGHNFSAVTAPRSAEGFEAVTQNETSITLRWKKVDDIRIYTLVFNEREINVTATADPQDKMTQLVSNLTNMTEYNFTLFTVFENVRSRGAHTTAFTAPPNAREVQTVTQTETSITLQWKKVNGILNYTLAFNGREINATASVESEQVTHTIAGLTSGTKYDFSLFVLFDNIRSSGVNHTAATAPRDPGDFQSVGQTETNITLQWKKVNGILNYRLAFNGSEINVTASVGSEQVTRTIVGLTCGTKYNFSLFALFENIRSGGVNHSAATVPSMVTFVNVTERSVTSVTLSWDVDVDKYWSYFLQIHGESVHLRPDPSEDVLSHSFTSLQPGTEHSFNVTTAFSGLNSTAYRDFTVTAIDCTSVIWHVTNSSIQGMVEGVFTTATATNKSQTHASRGGSNVSFTGLYPGATYEVSLMYERNSQRFQQCIHELTIIPPDLTADCEYWASGYAVYIFWNKPDGVWTAVEVNVTGKTYKTGEDGKQHITIPGFLPARTYKVSLASLSRTNRSSEPFVFSCSTDPRGVIAGSVFAVLLFVILVCLTVFILQKRPDIIRKNPFIGGSKTSKKKCKAISVEKFPDHFYQLNRNESRGFSQEYERLTPIGTEQTQKEALLPENKARNRFSNVLPYDWSRVKLTTSNPNATSDYINANYMPGYNSKREYIATQGPLPTTVNDFWRMIWEQRVKGIVMVTNCTEGGRTKCDRYWPTDSEPCFYGELLVTTSSEQQEDNWTLRHFTVKNSSTSEVSTVKHFHFTAWPDHGVPQGTEVLIHFRQLMRQHIQRDRNAAPTVVHCSAGVGRTGTIIALDVLLQQLEKERAVGINAFVHTMRLSRPHMVQTESQYVFLHQCIMDSLQQNEKTEENIYENVDMIYVNATALQDF